ncbi:TetR/AcrR family transcriptional regulator [Georgenia yuyongxinii]|uniref:TetR/AcrR family transcriptional regulator n=1 Tax=Georgenia yuyongxinii TaxID=2589797 RepID=A0A5B8C1K9_9MICO|nr:TetR/AcrR family transcriptional regulator [Georgenia yuyongxinii]QDC23987.1 TetR/AcrR family transcriptional regulator [Georgenia yuyongxinii]
MARYGSEHKEATRRRIVETAGRRLKRDGIDGSGIATLMADAGLTNGAFYAHFESKDDLVATVVGDQLGRQASEFSELPGGRAGLEILVGEYLSPAHRDHPDVGCPSAALLDEVGRCTEATKKAYTAGTKAILDEICTRLAPEDPESARGAALALFTMLVGSMQLARAVSDKELSDAVLEEGIRSAEALIRARTKQK